jgi:NAD(P)-dependent dehydrogenase (short-subunit alcohol dehydrogenase family)
VWLTDTAGSRVVTVSSVAHQHGRIDLDDLHFRQRAYDRAAAYGQSKLANLMFAYELQRRLAASSAPTISVAAYPGVVRTGLQRHVTGPARAAGKVLMPLLGQRDVAMGALPTLRAATDPGVHGGEYYGPDGFQGWAGYPVRAQSSARSRETEVQRRLWEESERLTGVTYPF